MHVAFQSLDYAQDTRIIYKLLVYGGKLNLKDFNEKTPIDYIQDMDDYNL